MELISILLSEITRAGFGTVILIGLALAIIVAAITIFLPKVEIKQKDYPGMKEFDIKTIEAEMRKKPTVTDKLDYWLKIKEKYIDKNQDLVDLFGKDYKLITPLRIPDNIYEEHFIFSSHIEITKNFIKEKFIFFPPATIKGKYKNALDDPEFAYWMLKYEAETYFNLQLRSLEKYYSEPEIIVEYIVSELKRLRDFETRANKLFIAKSFNIYSLNPPGNHWKEIELKRIHAGYYKSHTDSHPETVILFAEHVLYKKHLKNRLYELGTKDEISLAQNKHAPLSSDEFSLAQDELVLLSENEIPLAQNELALLRVYENKPFDYNNYDGIPEKWQRKESIKKLKDNYEEYDNIKARQSDHVTRTRLKNWIRKVKKVKSLLTVGKDLAEKDLTVLYQHLEKFESK